MGDGDSVFVIKPAGWALPVDPATNLPLTTVRDDLGLRASVGISVFWKSPLGPLRFDIAQPVAKEPYDVTQVFRFSTNTRF